MNSRKRTQGFTLVEMLLTITMGSLIMLSSVSVVHRSLQIRGLAVERLKEETAIERFISSWRLLVHRSEQIEIESTSKLTLTSGQSRVFVTFEDGILACQISSGSSGPLASFSNAMVRLGTQAEVTFERVAQTGVKLQIAHQGDSSKLQQAGLRKVANSRTAIAFVNQLPFELELAGTNQEDGEK